MIGSKVDLDLDLTSHRTPSQYPQTHGTQLRHNPPRTMESVQTYRIRRDVAGSQDGASLPSCGPLVVMVFGCAFQKVVVRMGPWRWVGMRRQANQANG